MVQIVLRSTKNDVGTLAVRVVNRTLGINTYVSLRLKIKAKDWVEATQLPKNMYDERPVKELNGLSYSQLTTIIQDIKKLLLAIDDSNTISVAVVKQVINEVVNKVRFAEIVVEIKPVAEKTKPTFLEFVETYIKECEDGERLKQKSTRKISAGTIKNYKGFLAQMKEYQKSRKRVIDWDDLTLDFYRDYKQFFIEKAYKPNTIARHIKNMKTMLYAAKDLHLTTRDDFMSKQWSADREDVDNIYIPEERLRQMYDFDMMDYQRMKLRATKFAKDAEEKNKLVHALKRDLYRRKLSEARDVFLMGCFTGQRVSDYKRIDDGMIETIQGDRKFLHLVQQKTDKDVYIPYNDMMGDILERYGGKLPSVYDQHLNERIKVVGLLLGWTEPADLTEHRGVMEYKSDKRFCDAIATHTARRTFATNAYKNGVPLSAIMAVTGHASEDMLRKYLKLNTKERALLAAAEFDKVKGL
jgi:integrase